MSLKQKGAEGVKWTFIEGIMAQGFAFVTTIILTRILLPEDFGLIGVIMVFLTVSRAIIEGGLGSSLIHDGEADERDFTTVFIANSGISILLYLILYLAAPSIANVFEDARITQVLRLLSLGLLISGASAIQTKLLMKSLAFKKLTLLRFPGILIGSLAAIISAYFGLTYWSLVIKELVTRLVDAVMLWSKANWTPRIAFDTSRFRKHFNYGYKLMLSSILNSVFTEIYSLVIGKIFSLSTLGFYNRANRFIVLPRGLMVSVVTKPTFPLLSSIKEDNGKVTAIYGQMIRGMFFIVAPVFVMLAVVAKPLFVILLTEKWLISAEYFSIICLGTMLYPVQNLNLNIFKVFGRTDLTLKLALVKKLLVLGVIGAGVVLGMKGLLWAMVVSNYLAFFINSWYSRTMIAYGPWEQIRDLAPTWIITMIVGGGGYMLVESGLLHTNLVKLLVTLPLMAGCYLLINYLARNPAMRDFQSLAQPFVKTALKKIRK